MDDLISRQAAIDALERIFDRCEEIEAHLAKGDPDRVGYKMYPDWLTVWKYLHQLPPAQPERMKGRWIKNADENCWWYECSECGDYPMKNAYGHEELSAYCPHCGAIMEGEEDDE